MTFKQWMPWARGVHLFNVTLWLSGTGAFDTFPDLEVLLVKNHCWRRMKSHVPTWWKAAEHNLLHNEFQVNYSLKIVKPFLVESSGLPNLNLLLQQNSPGSYSPVRLRMSLHFLKDLQNSNTVPFAFLIGSSKSYTCFLIGSSRQPFPVCSGCFLLFKNFTPFLIRSSWQLHSRLLF